MLPSQFSERRTVQYAVPCENSSACPRERIAEALNSAGIFTTNRTKRFDLAAELEALGVPAQEITYLRRYIATLYSDRASQVRILASILTKPGRVPQVLDDIHRSENSMSDPIIHIAGPPDRSAGDAYYETEMARKSYALLMVERHPVTVVAERLGCTEGEAEMFAKMEQKARGEEPQPRRQRKK